MNKDVAFWDLLNPTFWAGSPDSVRNLIVIVSIVVGLFFVVPRYLAARKTANATLKAAEISRAGHAWERFIKSMEDLRCNTVENKVAAVLAIRSFLEQNQENNRLALETLENYVRESCALAPGAIPKTKAPPPAEIQAILTLLGDPKSQKWSKQDKKQSLLAKWRAKDDDGRNGTGNRWYLDLTNTDLRNIDLRGADLCNARLHNTNLAGANLHGADLTGSDLRNACLDGAILSNADLSKANLSGASLRGASLVSTNLRYAMLWDVDLTNAHLARSVLTGAIVGKATFVKTQLQDADLRGGNFLGARFVNANLENAKYRLSELLAAEIILDEKGRRL